MPPEELTYEMVDELEQIAEDQHSMADACSLNAKSASALVDQVKSVLKERETELTREIRGERSPTKKAPTSVSGRRATGRGTVSGKAPQK